MIELYAIKTKIKIKTLKFFVFSQPTTKPSIRIMNVVEKKKGKIVAVNKEQINERIHSVGNKARIKLINSEIKDSPKLFYNSSRKPELVQNISRL